MTTGRKLETAIEMSLPPKARRRIEALMAEPSDDFTALVLAAGLDLKTSFRGKKLRIDFSDTDLSGFDFSGADLSNCDLSRANLTSAVFSEFSLKHRNEYIHSNQESISDGLIGIVLVSHNGLAREFLSAIQSISGFHKGIEAVTVTIGDEITSKGIEIREAARSVDQGNGVVFLTDMFGDTAASLIVSSVSGFLKNSRVVFGINLPLILKLLKSRHMPLSEAVRLAVDAGRKYINSLNIGPPFQKVFVSTASDNVPYARSLMQRLLVHQELVRRNVVEVVLDPFAHPRPDEGARNELETSVAALFIVGEKHLALMQQGELEFARRLQSKKIRPTIIPIFTSSAIPTRPPDGLEGYHFVHMPLDKPEAFDALVAAICQATDAAMGDWMATPPDKASAVAAIEQQPQRSAEELTAMEIEQQRQLKLEIREMDRARRTGRLPHF